MLVVFAATFKFSNDTLHVTSQTRSSRFSVCNITGSGMGTRLDVTNMAQDVSTVDNAHFLIPLLLYRYAYTVELSVTFVDE